jgi:hypothetical protein
LRDAAPDPLPGKLLHIRALDLYPGGASALRRRALMLQHDVLLHFSLSALSSV